MTTWERLAGDTERFGVRLAFTPDPDKDEYEDPAYGASWGDLQIWIDGTNVCAWRASASSGDAVRWYLLPFLEWVVRSWAPLFHEERLPLTNSAANAADALRRPPPIPLGLPTDVYYERLEEWQAWWQRHALSSASDGGVFPRLYLRRWGDLAEISWRTEDPVGVPPGYRFLIPSGVARRPVLEVAHALHDVVSDAVGVLAERHPASPRVMRLRDALRGVSAQPAEERLKWLLSASLTQWDRAKERLRDAVPAVRRTLTEPSAEELVIADAPQLTVLFGSAAPWLTEADVDTLTQLAVDAQSQAPASLPSMEDVLRAVEELQLPDFEQGNRLAEEVAIEFDLPDDQAVDIATLMEQLGVHMSWTQLRDPRIRAVSLLGSQGGALCALNREFDLGDTLEVERFSLAHELAHLLFDRFRSRHLAVVSGPWAPREIERRANAFAAALLMPRALLDAAAASSEEDYGSIEWVADIAGAAETSVSATIQRLANLALLHESERDALWASIA